MLTLSCKQSDIVAMICRRCRWYLLQIFWSGDLPYLRSMQLLVSLLCHYATWRPALAQMLSLPIGWHVLACRPLSQQTGAPNSSLLCGLLPAPKHVLTNAYHPQSNGMVECVRRQIKDTLCALGAGPAWHSHPPCVLLGVCEALK
jgi:hypothetical protein